MMRNDYRRSLILLRSNASGYSGHVRLERRTLMGTMYFLVQSPGDCPDLRAALVGEARDGGCYACALGELQRDARGQAVLSYSFDPRNICGRELEQYQLIAITCSGDESCQVVLFGNVCGHAELNWDSVRAALCEIYAAAPREEAPAQTAPVTELPPTGEPAQEPPAASEGPAAAEIEDAEILNEPIPAKADGIEVEQLAAAAGDAAVAAEGGDAACDLLEAEGIALNQPWPEAAEPLRTLFQTEAALREAPDDGCVYVEAPMPEGSGFPYVAAGLLILSGALAAVRYALPAAWSEEPPAGLEDCAWVGDQNRGWWVTEIPLEP